jgi:hypothetical protein
VAALSDDGCWQAVTQSTAAATRLQLNAAEWFMRMTIL